MAAAAILQNLKIAISQPQLGRFWRNLARWCSSTLLTSPTVKNLNFSKSKMASIAILKKQKTPYLGRGLTDFHKIWQDDAIRSSWKPRPLKIWKCQNLRWRRLPSCTIEKSPYLGRSSTDFDQIWHVEAFWIPWPSRPLKIQNWITHLPHINWQRCTSRFLYFVWF